ncbi:MAG: protein arginine kinase [Clostridia bacterium]|nr:protein arginine kinase [Clostridia bacterium]
MAWFNQTGAESDVVISSRIRFARNIAGIPFPGRMTDAQRSEVIEKVTKALSPANLETIDMVAKSPLEAQSLVEEHFISPAFAREKAPHTLLLSADRTAAVMIGEEDHVRIQTILPGLSLGEAYKAACTLDDLLDGGAEIAYSEDVGYLTQCPTNLGTAMRASVMLHLPAMTLAGQIGSVARSLSKLGITVRGLYGEGSEAAGALYQVSNSITMGLTEQEILDKLEKVARQLVESERKLRDTLKSDSFARLCDRVMRAFGVMKNAYMLSSEEFLKLWSDVRLGVSLGMITDIDYAKLGGILIAALPATLLLTAGSPEDTPAAERDVLRAKAVREAAA